ncbi:EF-hand domain-containing protein [Mariniflexile soesokkakense]|uniref:EF-hand domain-containing protein n=1 Tax=Mariniflexile soesokkakense TaxID=1343160 RepID=A0ABV0A9U2_9FLAO
MISKTLKFGLVAVALCAFSFSQAQEKMKPDPEKIFVSLDTNNDKLISLDEFKAKKRKNEVPMEALEKRFSAMDTNTDGLVNFDEFTASMHKRGEKHGNRTKTTEKN